MQQKRIKEILKQLAIKYNISVEEMNQICRSPLDFTALVIKDKSDLSEPYFPSVRITGFGVFYCSEGRRKFFKKLNEKQRNGGIQSGCVQRTDESHAKGRVQE